MAKKLYSNDEKLKIIQEAKEAGNIVATAKKYSISDGTIHAWIKKKNKVNPIVDSASELKLLRKQLSDMKLENSVLKDLLKKTVQVWTNEESSLMNTSLKNIQRKRY